MKIFTPPIGYYALYFAVNILVMLLMNNINPWAEALLRGASSLPLLWLIKEYTFLDFNQLSKTILLIIIISIPQAVVVWPENSTLVSIAAVLLLVLKVWLFSLYREEVKTVQPKNLLHFLLFVTPLAVGFLYGTFYLEPILPDEYLVFAMLLIFMDMMILSLAVHYCLLSKEVSVNVFVIAVFMVLSDFIIQFSFINHSLHQVLLWVYIINVFTRLFLAHSFVVDIYKKELTIAFKK